MATEDVLIKFEVDYSELDKAIASLEKTGKLDSKVAGSFSNASKAISTTTTDTQGLIKTFKDVSTSAIKMGKSVEDAFSSGMQDALDEAGVSVEQFGDALKKANKPVQTLVQESRQLKNALATMKLEGKATGEEFEKLKKRAGEVSDAIKDANQDIKNAGSDSRHLDNVVGSLTAVAGAFAAAQGAAALFGDEDKDLQKTLVKVTGAMALAQGLQQVYNATLKEGSLTKLADTVITGTQTAAIALYTFVTNGATLATQLLRAALLATGVGAVVVIVGSLISAMSSLTNETDKLKEAQEKFNDAQKHDFEVTLNGISRELEELKNLKRERLIGITDATKKFSVTQKISEAEIKLLKQKADAAKEFLSTLKATDKESVDDATTALLKANQDLRDATISNSEAIASEKDRINKESIKNAKENAEKEKEFILLGLNEKLSALEFELLSVEKGGQKEINISKDIITAKSKIQIAGLKEGAAQIKLIEQTALNDRKKLQTDFIHKLTLEQRQALIDANLAEMESIQITEERKLELKIDNLRIAASIEEDANKGKAEKLLLIEAKLQTDINALKNAAIEKNLNTELSAIEKKRQKLLELSKKIISDDSSAGIKLQQKAETEFAEESARLQKKGISDRRSANEQKIQSDKDYLAAKKDLNNEEVQIDEDKDEKIKAIDERAAERQKQLMITRAKQVLDISGQIGNILSQLGQQQTDADNARIKSIKDQIESQRAAGAISEREAKERLKKAEELQKQYARRAAQREHDLAVFQAILDIPRAFLQGLTGPGGNIYLAAIYGALAAIEAGIIASTPVPKFFKGKKDSYEGQGIVADRGAEIVERNGRMFLYTDPTQTYLGSRDKVYTAAESRVMMHNTDTRPMMINSPKSERFDYARLGSAIPKDSININIDKEFITESVANGLMRTNYMDRRYSSK